MNTTFSIILIVLIAIIIFIFISLFERFRLLRSIRREWGQEPYRYHQDNETSLKNALKIYRKHVSHDAQVDEVTWTDLDMFELYQQINATESSVGAEKLFLLLHDYNFHESTVEQLKILKNYFSTHVEEREKIQFGLRRLGKQSENSALYYLYEPFNNKIGDTKFFYVLRILLFVSIVVTIVRPSIGFILLIAMLTINVTVYLRNKNRLDTELFSMNYLVFLFKTAKILSKFPTPLCEEIKHSLKPFRSILRKSFSQVQNGSDLEVLSQYVDMVTLSKFTSYNSILSVVEKNKKDAQNIWHLVGLLDVSIALLNYELIHPELIQPSFHSKMAVVAEDMCHPLIKKPVSNEVDWRENTLVTGSNASGKSTYVKAIAINCILSQTVGICFATSFTLPHSIVLTSMALKDDVLAGDSYFIAEIKSIQRIVKKVESGLPCLCFIDEILRGTNTIERIAASASLMNWLGDYSSLVLIATHDIELTEILADQCECIHFQEFVTNNHGIEFDYKVYRGAATTRNAIKLLEVFDYPEKIVEVANSEAHLFEVERKWKKLKKEAE